MSSNMSTVTLPKMKRTKQWLVFARLWHLYDAKWQNPFDSSEKIVKVLSGRHKPIFHANSDCGDHVVVINCKDIAMPNDEWRYRYYYHHTMYAKGASYTPLWEVHLKDQTKIMEKAVYRQLGCTLLRKHQMKRLHLFPDDKIPKEILENVCDQMRQCRVVPKKLNEYTAEEIAEFPKLFDWPEDFTIK